MAPGGLPLPDADFHAACQLLHRLGFVVHPLRHPGPILADAVASYIAEHSPVSAAKEGRIINTSEAPVDLPVTGGDLGGIARARPLIVLVVVLAVVLVLVGMVRTKYEAS